MNYLEHYRTHGYSVVKGVFPQDEVAVMADACDRVKTEGLRHKSSFRHGNVLYLIEQDRHLGRVLRFLQWPAYVDDTLARYRTDRRLLAIVEPLIGNNLKQIINQIIWKTPGAARTVYAYHQDARFRRPPEAYRDLANAYVQTAIAIDPHGPDNGCMEFIPGSHKLGDLSLRADGSAYATEMDDAVLLEKGIDPAARQPLILDPGDVALWNPYIIHGSRTNESDTDRRFYANGYVIADNCDRGEWAFREGKPCALGEPQLVQYDDLGSRPEPHYIEGPPHPFKRNR